MSTSEAWHPIASSTDLVAHHVHQAMLNGHEYAVWRADDGYVNVWANRCLHRGVRLSIGSSDGAELKCAYHGWRYSNRTAGCTYIPAHPADSPARTICNETFPAIERYGLVWSSRAPIGELPAIGWLDGSEPLVLRGLPVNAPAGTVARALRGHLFPPGLDSDVVDVAVEASSQGCVVLKATSPTEETTVAFFVQPVDTTKCIVRGVVAGAPAPDRRMDMLREHNRRLSKLRDDVEAAQDKVTWVDPALRVHEVPIAVASGSPGRRDAPVEVRVRRKWLTATGVVAIELEAVDVALPTLQPGAHIDVHLPNGLVRQYSLTNAPGELDVYRIGVKLEANSRGGSRYLHESLRQGDELSISEPRANFPLRRDAVKTLLIAGGIGITPLLAMAQTLRLSGLDFELHYFAQERDHLAFPEVLDSLGDAFTPHLGLAAEATGDQIRLLLSTHERAHHAYVCGPGPMLETTRAIARERGWPDEAVHFEYFKNATVLDQSSTFTISLARSALTLDVPAGTTILDVLHQAGVAIPSSCEQGACGTCVATVLDGEPDHQDVHLNDTDKAKGDSIITCVSRARSERLVLDL